MSARAFALGLALAGCHHDPTGSDSGGTGGDTTDTVPVLDPAIEIGTGDVEFEPLRDGDECLIIFGPQGGYHFWASMRVQGIDAGNPDDLDDPANPVTAFHAWKDGVRIDLDASTYKQGIDPVPGEPGVYQMIGRQLRLDIQNDDDLDGVEVLIDVDVEDANGVTLHDERLVVGEPSPFNNDG